ncbi:MFS general substrate transporter [Mycena filopes]|nr:MFS general substrate transporter [Mycena filopes]
MSAENDVKSEKSELAAASTPAPDAPSDDDSRWTTTRRELWSYYLYYIGNSGLSGFNFGPSQFQNLLFLAGYDPTQAPFSAPCGDNGCVLPYLGRVRDINSIVLMTNGISFAIQAALLLLIGAWADYGKSRPNITIFFTVLAVAVSFAWLGVEDPAQWRSGVALYILGLITYQCSLTFWTAAFPGLARDLPEVKASLAEVKSGQKTLADHTLLTSLSRNRISNMSFTISSLGEIVVLAIMVGILKAVKSDQSTANNTKAFSILIAFSGAVWLVCAVPWFLFEKRRPGLNLPPGTGLLTIGFKQTYVAFRECLRLKHTFLYLVFYFLMGDVLNTTVTVIGTLQNSVVAYSTLQLTLLLIVGIVAQGLGIYGFWLVQKRFKISTKAASIPFTLCLSLLPLTGSRYRCSPSTSSGSLQVLTVWGLIGVHTDQFGFKHVWEIWLYQAFYGLMVCPWYAYSQTMISEVSPLPQMFLFFALFSVVGKTSAFIGPFVSSAIITAANDNDNMPFAFLFGLGVFSTLFLYLVDVDKSRIECEAFIRAEEAREAFALAPTVHFASAYTGDGDVKMVAVDQEA